MSENTILIWGAGAIGGTLGAYLARAGEDVLLVDIVEPTCGGHEARRAFHRRAGRDLPPAGEGCAAGRASTGQFKRIVLAVKAQHTRGGARR